MAIVMIQDNYLADIGDAIRNLNGDTATYKPSEMAAAIMAFNTDMENLIISNPSNTTLENTMVGHICSYGLAGIGSNLIDGWNIDLPEVNILYDHAFAGAHIQSLQLPKLQIVNDYCFINSHIHTLNLSTVESMSNKGSMFMNAHIGYLVWPRLITHIQFDDFATADIAHLILPGDSLVSLGSTDYGDDAINMASSLRNIYVPANLLTVYQQNAKWSKYTNIIRAIEDYPEIQALIE